MRPWLLLRHGPQLKTGDDYAELLPCRSNGSSISLMTPNFKLLMVSSVLFDKVVFTGVNNHPGKQDKFRK